MASILDEIELGFLEAHDTAVCGGVIYRLVPGMAPSDSAEVTDSDLARKIQERLLNDIANFLESNVQPSNSHDQGRFDLVPKEGEAEYADIDLGDVGYTPLALIVLSDSGFDHLLEGEPTDPEMFVPASPEDRAHLEEVRENVIAQFNRTAWDRAQAFIDMLVKDGPELRASHGAVLASARPGGALASHIRSEMGRLETELLKAEQEATMLAEAEAIVDGTDTTNTLSPADAPPARGWESTSGSSKEFYARHFGSGRAYRAAEAPAEELLYRMLAWAGDPPPGAALRVKLMDPRTFGVDLVIDHRNPAHNAYRAKLETGFPGQLSVSPPEPVGLAL